MLRRFARDRRGLAAIEFGLIAPIMLATYMGVAELTLGMMAQRRAAHAASVVADLVAQTAQINGTQMNDIFRIGGAILDPFPANTLQMRVTSITANAQGSPKVQWSQGSGMDALTAGSTATTPANLLAAGDSVVMAEVRYTYDSPMAYLLPNASTFTDTYYLRPRRSSAVTWTAG